MRSSSVTASPTSVGAALPASVSASVRTASSFFCCSRSSVRRERRVAGASSSELSSRLASAATAALARRARIRVCRGSSGGTSGSANAPRIGASTAGSACSSICGWRPSRSTASCHGSFASMFARCFRSAATTSVVAARFADSSDAAPASSSMIRSSSRRVAVASHSCSASSGARSVLLKPGSKREIHS